MKALAAQERRDIEVVIANESLAAAARHTDSDVLSFETVANLALAMR